MDEFDPFGFQLLEYESLGDGVVDDLDDSHFETDSIDFTEEMGSMYWQLVVYRSVYL